MASSIIFCILLIVCSILFYFLLEKNGVFKKTKVETIKNKMEQIDMDEHQKEFMSYLGYFNPFSKETPFPKKRTKTSIIQNTLNFINQKKSEFQEWTIHLFFTILRYFESSFFQFVAPLSKIYHSRKIT